ncbi:hypothetical protein ACH50_17390 [Franconibacter pulveris]|uniref:Uncharacterized protein n=1 Tax=Franconibacter pulveris TaxID=435910 RepID=A0A0J8VIW9_9ENTR|nr:hypothetical protein ACH50_17390 [Franconibacter pulveris]
MIYITGRNAFFQVYFFVKKARQTPYKPSLRSLFFVLFRKIEKKTAHVIKKNLPSRQTRLINHQLKR